MTGPNPTPPAEVEITEGLVRGLIADQHPDLAELPVAEFTAGWDNQLFRLGEDLLVRLPRREMGVPLVAFEHRWLATLAEGLPLPIPVPLRFGAPSPDFRWPWSIVPYFAGGSALHEPLTDSEADAEVLGEFVRVLHRPAPADAPVNEYRGIDLVERSERTRAMVDRLSDVIDGPSVTACWLEHVDLPRWEGPPLWLHGDMHPNNLLVHHGRLSAVIDFGDITSGDPATDLLAGWMLFDGPARDVFRRASTVDDDTWRRGRAWALALGVAYLSNSADNPAFARCGTATIEAVLADRW